MTGEQKLAFLTVCMDLFYKRYNKYAVVTGTTFNLSLGRINPHRILQPYHTDCYGNFYSDTWARDQVAVRMNGELNILKAKLLSLVEALKLFLTPRSVGASDYSCDGHIEI
jgi:hypothetical protein